MKFNLFAVYSISIFCLWFSYFSSADPFVDYPLANGDLLVPKGEAVCDVGKACGNPDQRRTLQNCCRRWGFIHQTFRRCVPRSFTEADMATYVCNNAILMQNCILTNTPHDSMAKIMNIQQFHKCIGIDVSQEKLAAFGKEADNFKAKYE